MSLKVIGAGRTGTMTLKAALEELGYNKTHHITEVLPDSKQRNFWQSIAKGERPNWQDVFEGFEASCDFPSATHYKELMEAFPDSKVILTVRDPDSWYQSAMATIYPATFIAPFWARTIIPPLKKFWDISMGCIWQRLFDGRFKDKTYALSVFSNYIDEVKTNVPQDRLLVYEVKEGWKPLCEFLDHEIPETDFPHVNDAANFKKMITRGHMVFLAIYVVLAFICITLLWWLIGSMN